MFAKQLSSTFQRWKSRVRVSVTSRLLCSNMFVAEFREDIRIIIPDIGELLKHSDPDNFMGPIQILSKLEEQGMC